MSSSSLEVPRRQRTEKRSKLWRVLIIVATVAVAVGWLVWFLRTPGDLPTSSGSVDDAGVVGQELYIGMVAVGDDFDRTITISEVDVDVTADGEVDVEPRLCRGGSLSVTTDAAPFCPGLDDVDGAEFSDGDSIVLVVSAAEPTEVEIGQIEISFREGIKWGTKPAGIDGATLSFVEHDPGIVEEDPEPEDPTSQRPDQDDEKDRDNNRDKDRKKDREGGTA